jgi:sterol desaturase/sphingolipid hydroxylase (fatty acid hydroxylase superfamily)/predicted amino acid dehydrogenase
MINGAVILLGFAVQYFCDIRWNMAIHLMTLTLLRYYVLTLLNAMSTFLVKQRGHKVNGYSNMSEKQLEREDDWDSGFVIHNISFIGLSVFTPILNNCNEFGPFGSIVLLLLTHVFVVEPVYWILHYYLHFNTSMWKSMHYYHHQSIQTMATTGNVQQPFEHMLYTINFAIPMMVQYIAFGQTYLSYIYGYILIFDALNALGHINIEIMPKAYIRSVWRYLLYSPSFHAIHHSRFTKNFALFMPIWDYIFGTLDQKSWEEAFECEQEKKTKPSTVFLVHGGTTAMAFCMPFFPTTIGLKPFEYPAFLAIFYPIYKILIPIAAFFWNKVFVVDNYRYLEILCSTWAIPMFAYSLVPGTVLTDCEKARKYIKEAVLKAEKERIDVVGLGWLTKAEWINRGGDDTLKDLESEGKNLKHTKLVHGNTLTSAVVIMRTLAVLKPGESVFLIGGTSKIGRAIALYLAKKGIVVNLLTQSQERFDKIRNELSWCERHLIRLSTDQSGGKDSAVWCVGKSISIDWKLVPKESTIVDFTVPMVKVPVERKDLIYIEADHLKYNSEDCDMVFGHTIGVRKMFACHAGAIVHSLEGYTNHEVGEVDISKIDMVFDAAMKHRFYL